MRGQLNKIIGLSGYAQSGKDTVGAYLVNNYGYHRVAFADPVREAVYTLNPVILDVDELIDVKTIVDEIGWERAKTEWPEIRRLLQVMGTEVGRTLFGEDVWVNIAKRKADEHNFVVVTDVRFPNEAAAIRSWGGSVWRIERPGVVAVNSHSSEALDFDADVTISNNHTIDSLCRSIDQLLDATY